MLACEIKSYLISLLVLLVLTHLLKQLVCSGITRSKIMAPASNAFPTLWALALLHCLATFSNEVGVAVRASEKRCG